MAVCHRRYKRWEPEAPQRTVHELPVAVLERLHKRAEEAGCSYDGKPSPMLLLERAWLELGGGHVTFQVFDMVEAGALDDDLRALQRASIKDAMDRGRANYTKTRLT